MASKGPKTLKGAVRKALTGDGRKNLSFGFSDSKGKKGKKK